MRFSTYRFNNWLWPAWGQPAALYSEDLALTVALKHGDQVFFDETRSKRMNISLARFIREA